MKKFLTAIAKEVVAAALKAPNRIELKRDYKDGVTLGAIKGYINNVLVVDIKSIELKWNDNKPRISCIPEDIYDIEPDIWNKHQMKVLGIKNVPNRSRILMHPANYASGKHIELLGCIAPVTGFADLDKDGIIDGTASRSAFGKLMHHFGNIKCKLIIYS